jgi:geranylgeranyl diphosphate synthase type I
MGSAGGSAERLDDRPRSAPATVLPMPAGPTADVAAHLGWVDRLLGEVLTDLTRVWTSELENPSLDRPSGVDILESSDLPDLLAGLCGAGGKRLRPVMSYLGWVAGGGQARDTGAAAIVRVGAALELLHVFALIHDDVMDESTWRRGQPTIHAQARRRHDERGGRGSAQRFGESIAILLGDLAHAEADRLVAELPAPMRRIWHLLVVELVCGQRRDLTGSAAGRRDLSHAREVARLKSGAYTVQRPLELGAAAARAPELVTDCLSRYGRELGEAFALRDDLLGVWGDPSRTGKPVGDDLAAGKPTVLLALAHLRLRGPAADLLHRVVAGRRDPGDVECLLVELESAGLRGEVEELIGRHVRAAVDALDERLLDPSGLLSLQRMAVEIAWRDR